MPYMKYRWVAGYSWWCRVCVLLRYHVGTIRLPWMRGVISLPCFSHMWQFPGVWPLPNEVVASGCAVLYVRMYRWMDDSSTYVCWGGGVGIVHHGIVWVCMYERSVSMFFAMTVLSSGAESVDCSRYTTCDSCIAASVNCAWCADFVSTDSCDWWRSGGVKHLHVILWHPLKVLLAIVWCCSQSYLCTTMCVCVWALCIWTVCWVEKLLCTGVGMPVGQPELAIRIPCAWIYASGYQFKAIAGTFTDLWSMVITKVRKLSFWQVKRRQHVRIMQPHAERTSTHSFTQGWAHRHTVHYFSFLFNSSSFTVVPNNLASHEHYTV